MNAEDIIEAAAVWARAQPTIRAVALVGSFARGMGRADSDMDLVLLTTHPRAFRSDTAWLDAIKWNAVGARPIKWKDEDYGELWSRRVWLEKNAGEVEFGFASLSWADIDPVDPGTRRVIMDGHRILHDPDKILHRLCVTVTEAEL